MKIEYENRFSDVLLFNAVHQLLSPILQGFYFLFLLLILWSEWNYKQDFASSVTTAIIWYLVIWVVQLIFNVLYLYSRKNKSVLTKHTVEIQDEAFLEETKYNRSYFFWNGIVKVVRRPGFVAVYVTPHMAHIIPRRAFSSESQMASFINECKSKLKAA